MLRRGLVVGVVGLLVLATAFAGVRSIVQPAFAAAPVPSFKQQPLAVESVEITAKVDLARVALTWQIQSTNRTVVAAPQIIVERSDLAGQNARWETFAPLSEDGKPATVALTQKQPARGTFYVNLPKGRYGGLRLILFAADANGKPNYGEFLYDNEREVPARLLRLDLVVRTSKLRVWRPVLAPIRFVQSKPDGDGTTHSVTLSADIKVPRSYKGTGAGDGFWVLAKSGDGKKFSQAFAPLTELRASGDADDDYQLATARLTLNRLPPGPHSLDVGLFRKEFGEPIQWLSSGAQFEAGSGGDWQKPAPANSLPPRLRVWKNQFVTAKGAQAKPYNFYAKSPNAGSAVSFVRGGNHGNAIARTITPVGNDARFFRQLRRQAHCRFVRFNYNADRYLDEPLYRHVVDQAIQNIWAAGLYPLIAPQELPEGDTREERANKLNSVLRLVAQTYKGKPVWIELCNEPFAYNKWDEWKPVAIRLAKTIRAVDPQAFVVCPFEGYGKDGRAAAKSPITEVAIDLYDGHAYIAPTEMDALFGTPARAGLPVLIGEYGSTDALYLRQMSVALQNLPKNVLSVAPWAFTIAGEDSIPLLKTVPFEDAKTPFTFTDAGQAVVGAFVEWENGRRLR